MTPSQHPVVLSPSLCVFLVFWTRSSSTCGDVSSCLLSSAAIHEFPRDYFTNQERVDGAVGLHVLCVSLSCAAPPTVKRQPLSAAEPGVCGSPTGSEAGFIVRADVTLLKGKRWNFLSHFH